MLEQRILDLDRRNIFAAGDDDVLGAVLELNIAVLMHHAEVAGMKPAAVEGGVGGVLVLQIALHDDIAEKHHLAHGFALSLIHI